MRSAVWAILYHSASSDEDLQHDYCPKGENSWCGWQRDVAKGVQTYKHKSPLAPAVVEVIKPVFEALSADELLDRCLEGATQNQNESINAVVWGLLTFNCSNFTWNGKRLEQTVNSEGKNILEPFSKQFFFKLNIDRLCRGRVHRDA